MQLPQEHLRQLNDQGYVLIDGAIPSALLSGLRERVEQLFVEEGEAAGLEFKQEAGARRLANLVNKGDIFWQVIADPLALAYVRHVLGGELKLSSLNARSVLPGATRPQPLHCDMGAVPDARGYWVCNVVWMLDDFTTENGALRVVPGTHRLGRLPQQEVTDLCAPHPRQVHVTGPAGSILVMNAHLWHGGLGNRTGRARTAVHAFYCRRDKPQQQYQKQLLDAGVQKRCPPALRELLALDDPQNDELSRQDVRRSGFL